MILRFQSVIFAKEQSALGNLQSSINVHTNRIGWVAEESQGSIVMKAKAIVAAINAAESSVVMALAGDPFTRGVRNVLEQIRERNDKPPDDPDQDPDDDVQVDD